MGPFFVHDDQAFRENFLSRKTTAIFDKKVVYAVQEIWKRHKLSHQRNFLRQLGIGGFEIVNDELKAKTYGGSSYKKLGSKSDQDKSFSQNVFHGLLSYILLKNTDETPRELKGQHSVNHLIDFINSLSIDFNSSELNFKETNAFLEMLRLSDEGIHSGRKVWFDEMWLLHDKSGRLTTNKFGVTVPDLPSSINSEQEYRNYIVQRFKYVRLPIDISKEIEIHDAIDRKLKTHDVEFIGQKRSFFTNDIPDRIPIHDKNSRILFDLMELLNEKRNVFIASEGGSGKSTLLGMTMYRAVSECENILPVLINLQRRPSISLIDEINDELARFGITFPHTKKVTLFIDSLDEFQGNEDEIIGQVIDLKDRFDITSIITGRHIPATATNQEFIFFEIASFFLEDIERLFELLLGKGYKRYFSYVRKHEKFRYLENPLYCTFFLSNILIAKLSSGGVKFNDLNRILGNRGELMKMVVVESYLKSYERKHAKKIISNDWLSLKKEQIRFISALSNYLILNVQDSLFMSISQVELFAKDLNLKIHDIFCYSIKDTLDDFRNHGILNFHDEKVYLRKPDYYILFSCLHLATEIKTREQYESYLNYFERETEKYGEFGLEMAEILSGIIPTEIFEWREIHQLTAQELSSDKIKHIRHLLNFVSQGRTFGKNASFFRKKIWDLAWMICSKESFLVDEFLNLLYDFPLDLNHDQLMDNICDLPDELNEWKYKLLKRLFAKATRKPTLLSAQRGAEISSYLFFNTPSHLKEYLDILRDSEELVGLQFSRIGWNPNSVFEQCFRYNKSFTYEQQAEIIALIHGVAELNQNQSANYNRFSMKTGEKIARVFFDFLFNTSIVLERRVDVAVFYKLVKTIGMFKRTQSNDCIRLPFMSRLEFHVFDEGDPKIDEIYLTRLMIKSEFSFFDDLSWLLKIGRTNMIYEFNIDYLIQKIVTYAGLDGHLGMDESILKLKEFYQKSDDRIKEWIDLYSEKYGLNWI